jgi:hypothetical protein
MGSRAGKDVLSGKSTGRRCVWVPMAGAGGPGVGRGRTLIRAVSFLGPRIAGGASALGLSGVEFEPGGVTGGRRGKTRGPSVVAAASIFWVTDGVMAGGNLRTGAIGVRAGSTIRVASRGAAAL